MKTQTLFSSDFRTQHAPVKASDPIWTMPSVRPVMPFLRRASDAASVGLCLVALLPVMVVDLFTLCQEG